MRHLHNSGQPAIDKLEETSNTIECRIVQIIRAGLDLFSIPRERVIDFQTQHDY
jgi:hypothetical protein